MTEVTQFREEASAPLRLLLGGDVMLGRQVGCVLALRGAAYPLSALSTLLDGADLFFVNLECAISGRSSRFAGAPKAFYFRADPSTARVLAMAGVDLVNLANNHSLDADIAGLGDMLATLSSHGIACVGAGPDLAAASAMRVLDCKGARIGVLAACDHQSDFAASARRPGIHYVDLRDRESRRNLVARVARQAACVDHLIVSLHWLPNWVPTVPALYRELAAELIAAGARVLWGHSPHHILGSEVWPTGVAIYSSGDLIDDYALEPGFRNDRQLIYQLELGRGGVERIVAHPITLRVGRAEPADPVARQWIGERLVAACAALGSRVLGDGDGAFEIRPAQTGAAPASGRISDPVQAQPASAMDIGPRR